MTNVINFPTATASESTEIATIQTEQASENIQTILDSVITVAPTNPNAQSLKGLDSGRFSGNTLAIEQCTIWEENLNRIEWGNVPAIAYRIAFGNPKKADYPGILEGFIEGGLFHVTDGARRLIAGNFALTYFVDVEKNREFLASIYSPEQMEKITNLTEKQIEQIRTVPIKLVEGTKAELLATQITSETLNKTPEECAEIVGKILECVNPDTNKNYTQREAGLLVNRDDATITGYVQYLRKASDELKAAVKSGECTFSDAIAEVKSVIKTSKQAAKASGNAIMQSVKAGVPTAKSKEAKADKANYDKLIADIVVKAIDSGSFDPEEGTLFLDVASLGQIVDYSNAKLKR
jgi:hypothetical protein